MKGVYYVTHSEEVERAKYACSVCGLAVTELGECPRCKMQVEETARELRERQERDALFREIDQIVEEQWDGDD